MHGGLKSKMKKEFLKEANTSSIILSTSSFIGEGIDFSHLDAIVLTMPVSYWGKNSSISWTNRKRCSRVYSG